MRIQEAQLLYNNALLQDQLETIEEEKNIELSKLNKDVIEEVELLAKELDEVYCAIRKASMEKKDSIKYDGRLSEETIKRLRQDGFIIKDNNISGWVKKEENDKSISDKLYKLYKERLKFSVCDNEQITKIENIILEIVDRVEVCKSLSMKEIIEKYKEQFRIDEIIRNIQEINNNNTITTFIKSDLQIDEKVINYYSNKQIFIKPINISSEQVYCYYTLYGKKASNQYKFLYKVFIRNQKSINLIKTRFIHIIYLILFTILTIPSIYFMVRR